MAVGFNVFLALCITHFAACTVHSISKKPTLQSFIIATCVGQFRYFL